MKKFIEFVGNASTTAVLDGKRIGQNVSVAAYESGDGVVCYLESGGSPVRGVNPQYFKSANEFADWKYTLAETGPLFSAAINTFGASTSFSKADDYEDDFYGR